MKSTLKKLFAATLVASQLLTGMAAFAEEEVDEVEYEEVEEETANQAVNEVGYIHPMRPTPVDVHTEPFTIMVLGIDTGEYEQAGKDKADVTFVITVNPNTGNSTVLSVPNNLYVLDPATDEPNQLTHTYTEYGVAGVANSLQALLNIPIDYYITLDMEGFHKLIGELGNLTLTPTETFTQEGYEFVEDEPVDLDGEGVLQYLRQRDHEKNNYGVQTRAVEILSALLLKMNEEDSLDFLPAIESILQDHVLTNLDIPTIEVLADQYYNTIFNIDFNKLEGHRVQRQGRDYEEPNPVDLEEAINTLRTELELD